MAVSTSQGAVHVYLTKLPILGDALETKVAYLTSLREITIVDEGVEEKAPIKITTQVEPSFVALGNEHLACGMNNRVWFCTIEDYGKDSFLGQFRKFLVLWNLYCVQVVKALHVPSLIPVRPLMVKIANLLCWCFTRKAGLLMVVH